jgi:hypothetical protein
MQQIISIKSQILKQYILLDNVSVYVSLSSNETTDELIYISSARSFNKLDFRKSEGLDAKNLFSQCLHSCK